MKFLKKYGIFVVLAIVLLLGLVFFNKPLRINELGVPTKEYYPYNTTARCVWDMEIFENKLYLGCGDNDTNSGPTPLLFCDMDSLGEWKSAATLDEEQIGRFLILDNKLTIPGLDSVSLPDSSVFYQVENGELKPSPAIADCFHIFDLVKFDGKTFLGIGGAQGLSSVVYTQDNETYIKVPMYKNGKDIIADENLYVRTHNLYVLNDTLFAQFWCEDVQNNSLVSEIYQYTGQRFEYHTTLTGKLHSGVYCRNIPAVFSKAILNDTVFITTGYLYFSKDMETFTRIGFPDDARVYDIYQYDNRLYFLAAAATEEGYKVSIYSTVSESVYDFKKEITFDYTMHPTAFAVRDNNYYIAFGDWENSGSDTNGTIVSIEGN